LSSSSTLISVSTFLFFDKIQVYLRDNTSFSYSKLGLEQVVDLMYYWSQDLDSHIHLKLHCKIKGDATIVDWKNLCGMCVNYCIKHPSMIGGVGHIIEIDESA
jgi:hypothetical protein